jgi:hypothetical protein
MYKFHKNIVVFVKFGYDYLESIAVDGNPRLEYEEKKWLQLKQQFSLKNAFG